MRYYCFERICESVACLSVCLRPSVRSCMRAYVRSFAVPRQTVVQPEKELKLSHMFGDHLVRFRYPCDRNGRKRTDFKDWGMIPHACFCITNAPTHERKTFVCQALNWLVSFIIKGSLVFSMCTKSFNIIA